MIICKFELSSANSSHSYSNFINKLFFLSKIRRKAMTPFKCLKFCCHIQFSFTTHQCPNILLNQTTLEKKPKNKFEDTELTAVWSYSMWNSWNKLEREWNLQRWSTKTPHSLGLFCFGLGVFKRCNILLWKLTCYDFRVFQNFKTNLTSVEYLKRHFLNHSVFFISKRLLIDR